MKPAYFPGSPSGRCSGVDIEFVRSTQQITVGGWYDGSFLISPTTLTLREFFERVGIREEDCEKAWKEAETMKFDTTAGAADRLNDFMKAWLTTKVELPEIGKASPPPTSEPGGEKKLKPGDKIPQEILDAIREYGKTADVCAGCKYFALYTTVCYSLNRAGYDGFCHRFPREEDKTYYSSCGEFVRKEEEK